MLEELARLATQWEAHPLKSFLTGASVPLARMTVADSASTVANPTPGNFFTEKPVHTVHTVETTKPKNREQISKQLQEIRNSVSAFDQFLPSLLSYLQASCSNFRAVCKGTKFST